MLNFQPRYGPPKNIREEPRNCESVYIIFLFLWKYRVTERKSYTVSVYGVHIVVLRVCAINRTILLTPARALNNSTNQGDGVVTWNWIVSMDKWIVKLFAFWICLVLSKKKIYSYYLCRLYNLVKTQIYIIQLPKNKSHRSFDIHLHIYGKM